MEKNNRYKILIIGTGDLCNYGCEAIIHGTYTILNHTIGNCDFYIASDVAQRDCMSRLNFDRAVQNIADTVDSQKCLLKFVP